MPWRSLALLPIAGLEQERALLFPWLRFPRCPCLCKTACAWKGCRLAAPCGAAAFQLSLHAIQAQGRQESAFHASLAKKHSGASFGRQKGCLSSTRVLLVKIPQGTTALLFFYFSVCGRSPSSFFKFFCTVEKRGTAWPVFLLLLSAAFLCQTARDAFSN